MRRTGLTPPPWHVFVGMPADAVLSGSRINLFQALAFGTLSLLLGAALAAWLGAQIAQPLRQLAYDAMLFARGNLAHRTSVGGEDETGVLASTLNRMAQLVEDRTRALQEKTAALEDHRAPGEGGPGGFWSGMSSTSSLHSRPLRVTVRWNRARLPLRTPSCRETGVRRQKTDNGIGDPVSAESGGLVYAIAAFCCLLLSVSEFFLTSVF